MEEKSNKFTLQRARDYEKEMAVKIPSGQRPVFHLCPPVGWLNDPNGFSVYQGEYHLFYQYYPYDAKWGPMHWGHSRTKDFIRWEQLPAALAPDQEYDGQGCFSGSAVEHEGKHILMYTGVQEKKGPEGNKIRQRQCIAVGNGIDYEKLPANPVILAEQLPEGSSLEDFRDPRIWKEKGRFYAVMGSRAADECGQIALFESPDARKWEFVTILESCHQEFGKMWECPDFFSLDGKQVLLASPMDMLADGLEFHSGNGTLCLIGTYDDEKHSFARENKGQAIDYGFDFYAPQTLETPDGRRVMVGWMQNWDYHITPADFAWSGMMTVPRELSVRDGRLYQVPVRELALYHTDMVKHTGVRLGGIKEAEADLAGGEGTREDQTNAVTAVAEAADEKQADGRRAAKELAGVSGRSVDLYVDVEPGDWESFSIDVAADDTMYTRITYDRKKQILKLDRSRSGLRRDIVMERRARLTLADGRLSLRIVLDRYSVEVFASDGSVAMTALVYTPQEADGIRFDSCGTAVFDVTKYEIRV